MGPLLEIIKAGHVLVSDGAMGTSLFERGLKPGESPEQWNISSPDVIRQISEEYLNAGADIIETNTFGASPIKLSEFGIEDKTDEINKQAVLIAQDAAAGKAYTAGSVGPTGQLLEPYGELSPETAAESYNKQIAALCDNGVDVICIETMTDLNEAKLAIKASNSVSGTTPVIATMSFDKTPNGYFTIMGVDIKTAARSLEEAGADIIGANCGCGIEDMANIANEFLLCSDLPIIIQSNAGMPEFIDGRLIYHETPENFFEFSEKMASSGISIIGGCCGTTPAHIKAVRRSVDIYHKRAEN